MERDQQIAKSHNRHIIKFLDQLVSRIEEIFYSAVLLVMIVIGLAPIIMRFSGKMGFTWTESLSQHMVLWIAMLGAGTAVRERSSISIDVIPHLLQTRGRLFIQGITELISSVICSIIVWVSFAFVGSVVKYDADTVAFLGIREWWLTCALPIGFTILTLRLIVAGIEDIVKAAKLKKGEEILPPPAVPVEKAD